jgi:hypothetical protein
MVDFAKLKSSSQDSLRRLTEQVNKLNSNGERKNDENYWKPTLDKAGNGSAILRFLPAPPGEDLEFVRYWDHGFQGPGGKWYIENSRTTLGDKDPVTEYNAKLWRESDNDESPQRKQVRKQKRREHYVANVLVIKDPGNPENNGKVFLYKFGKKIFNKLNELMNPIDDGIDEIKPINPFDMWSGADFYLRIRKVEGYSNYDKSDFGQSRPVSEDDNELERIWKMEHPLQPIVSPSNFKPYEELERRLNEVLELNAPTRRPYDDGPSVAAAPALKQAKSAMDEDEEEAPWAKPSVATKSVAADEDDDMAFFRNLAKNNE